MGRKDIVEYLLSKGARPDLFCATMLGQLETVKAMLTLQPKLIDSKARTASACTSMLKSDKKIRKTFWITFNR
jgi:hypothetical protein